MSEKENVEMWDVYTKERIKTGRLHRRGEEITVRYANQGNLNGWKPFGKKRVRGLRPGPFIKSWVFRQGSLRRCKWEERSILSRPL